VWSAEDVKALNVLGENCRMLITTRDASIITALGARQHRLDKLSDQDSLKLLSEWTGLDSGTLPEEASLIVKECGNLPLALALCGAQIRDGILWRDILVALQEADLQFLDHPFGSVMRSLKVSIDALEDELVECYLKLAVFPSDEPIPEVAIATLWSSKSDHQVRRILSVLENKALLQRLENKTFIQLHDPQHDYLREICIDIKELHKEMLVAYQRKALHGWSSGPNDGYFFQHLTYHLLRAGQQLELKELLFSFKWLKAKVKSNNINSLLSDYLLISDDDLQLVQGAIRLSAHIISQEKDQLNSQLIGRLIGYNSTRIKAMLDEIREDRSFPWLCPLTPSFYPSGGQMIRTFQGHSGSVRAVAIMPDDRIVVSASNDNTLKVWDLEDGREIKTLNGHTDLVSTVALIPGSRNVISGSNDGTLKVWDPENGLENYTLTDHGNPILAVAVTSDGREAISGSEDGTLNLWDLEKREKIRTFKGHDRAIWSVAFVPDGSMAVSCSQDKTLKIWNFKSAKEIDLLGHKDFVRGVAVTPDGRRVLSASFDGTLKIWDLKKAQEINTLKGHYDKVWAVTTTPDGSRAISASDKTLRVWDLKNSQMIAELKGHTDCVLAVAVTSDGSKVISGSMDRNLKLWDLNKQRALVMPQGHDDDVTAIVVTHDGRKAITSSWDRTIKIWNIKSGKIIKTLRDIDSPILAMAIMPNNQKVLSGSSDGTLLIWDFEKGGLAEFLGRFNDGLVTTIAVTPNGSKAIAGSDDNILKVWDINNKKEIGILQGA
jgi:WD40 repeat protein